MRRARYFIFNWGLILDHFPRISQLFLSPVPPSIQRKAVFFLSTSVLTDAYRCFQSDVVSDSRPQVSWSAPVTVATEVAAGEQPQWSPRGSPSSAKPKRRRLPAVPGGRGAAAAPAATAVDSQGARDRRRISPRKGLAFMPPAQVPTAAAAAAVVPQYHEAYSSVDAPSPQRKPREGSQLCGHQVDMTSPPRKQWQAPAAQQWQPTYVEPSDRAAGGYESPRQPPNERHQHQQLSLQQQHPQHHRPQRERSVRGSTNEGVFLTRACFDHHLIIPRLHAATHPPYPVVIAC